MAVLSSDAGVCWVCIYVHLINQDVSHCHVHPLPPNRMLLSSVGRHKILICPVVSQVYTCLNFIGTEVQGRKNYHRPSLESQADTQM